MWLKLRLRAGLAVISAVVLGAVILGAVILGAVILGAVVLGAVALGALASAGPADAAETNELRLARQPGLVYLQAIIMEDKRLVEKHAAALGLPDLKVTYAIITS